MKIFLKKFARACALVAVVIAASTATLAPAASATTGYWVFVNNANSLRCMAVPGGSNQYPLQLIQWDCLPEHESRLWHPDFLGRDGFGNPVFRFMNMDSGHCLAIGGASPTPGRPAIQWPCGTGNEQKWAYDGMRRLHNVATNQCLAVPGGSWEAGTGLIQWPCGTGLEQRWYGP